MGKEYLWGYLDKEGNMAIEPRFHGADEFHEGLAAVKIDWARGYIDKTGNFVIEPKYQYAGSFNNGKALVELDGLWGYIRPDGTWEEEPHRVEGNPIGCTPLTPGEIPSEYEYSDGLAVALKGKKYGYVDQEKKFVIKAQYKQAKPFSEGLGAVLCLVNSE